MDAVMPAALKAIADDLGAECTINLIGRGYWGNFRKLVGDSYRYLHFSWGQGFYQKLANGDDFWIGEYRKKISNALGAP